VNGRAPFGRHVEGVDDVLDAERHAAERPVLAVLVEGAGGGKRGLAVEMRPGVDFRFAYGDALKAGVHHGLAGGLSLADRCNDLGRGQFVERFDGAAPCCQRCH
jgi:hypothetical protein